MRHGPVTTNFLRMVLAPNHLACKVILTYYGADVDAGNVVTCAVTFPIEIY